METGTKALLIPLLLSLAPLRALKVLFGPLKKLF
jgi:hypothetical protein